MLVFQQEYLFFDLVRTAQPEQLKVFTCSILLLLLLLLLLLYFSGFIHLKSIVFVVIF